MLTYAEDPGEWVMAPVLVLGPGLYKKREDELGNYPGSSSPSALDRYDSKFLLP